MDSKYGPLEKRIKTTDIHPDEIFQKYNRYALFDHKRNKETLPKFKAEPADEKLRN
jgi:hypothetical protein